MFSQKGSSPKVSEETLQNMADILHILAHPLRIKIIFILAEKPATVSELIKMLDVRQPNLSQHLTLLKRVKLLRTRREGKSVYYQINYPEIKGFLEKAKELVEVIQERPR
ncbi:MAG TPA: metalloregulator ArsR/SmtB family transcription factor [Dictyoglomaceae bacterium]|nr:metalloregulator ArsR/SmtB family transcription factor [Dictyoglomaceae bacterium]HOL39180.1 metalloregulator ArsR/SmtB family transcription factor [Dictyoglomaceae bacterium]HOP94210.1 metalloregulator ArsR/SmtB family transcription factor [Dictyoglomaceae bacterium]HPP15334.1 metalloregulator ArsR/SmtB family transcription factor [Dictyoglomaceae bacterium]HPU44034.1 metalloregulator ArsR/SmtB family transcription factor [Dictyoglomaceae bacterium]